jgi:hypothetical protein
MASRTLRINPILDESNRFCIYKTEGIVRLCSIPMESGKFLVHLLTLIGINKIIKSNLEVQGVFLNF